MTVYASLLDFLFAFSVQCLKFLLHKIIYDPFFSIIMIIYTDKNHVHCTILLRQ